ncbi:hypothetical protein GOP47_0015901 [Adiantum capillus-veneris]|uniref:Uncharacterized protein n=1 Tax=Adiantum capillus-veneris TaxID=13818 RepID=A0A9D4UKK4_ADICA|nr:hypothetical protein GOP47_0015901 [Adiantum capillus-veneris]
MTHPSTFTRFLCLNLLKMFTSCNNASREDEMSLNFFTATTSPYESTPLYTILVAPSPNKFSFE